MAQWVRGCSDARVLGRLLWGLAGIVFSLVKGWYAVECGWFKKHVYRGCMRGLGRVPIRQVSGGCSKICSIYIMITGLVSFTSEHNMSDV